MNDKEVRIPVVSYHCRITHSACDCVLRRLKLLGAVAEAAEQHLARTSSYSTSRSQIESKNNLDKALAALHAK